MHLKMAAKVARVMPERRNSANRALMAYFPQNIVL
jgi:hypothetical protein